MMWYFVIVVACGCLDLCRRWRGKGAWVAMVPTYHKKVGIYILL